MAVLLAVTAAILPLSASSIDAGAQSQISEQGITFRVSSITLSGTLLRPAGHGVYPGIVLLHGSGPGPRQHLRLFAERFARLGFAALIFDKRGSGESGGSWTEESLDDLADDALAAAAFLREQPDVDKQHVGVWGISQSGWVIPHVAARAPDAFAFAIIVTGGAVKPLEVEQYDYSTALDRIGAVGQDRQAALALVERYFTYLRSGNDRGGLESAIEAARGKPWFNAVDVGRVLPSDSARSKWEWVASYDPVSDIRQMKMPVLVVLGGKDRPALTMKMFDEWRSYLPADANADATVLEFLNAEHGIAVVGTHHNLYAGGPPTYAPGYLEMLDAWLRAHGSATPH